MRFLRLAFVASTSVMGCDAAMMEEVRVSGEDGGLEAGAYKVYSSNAEAVNVLTKIGAIGKAGSLMNGEARNAMSNFIFRDKKDGLKAEYQGPFDHAQAIMDFRIRPDLFAQNPAFEFRP